MSRLDALWAAAEQFSAQMCAAGVRHVLIGSLAAETYAPLGREPRDVDFVVVASKPTTLRLLGVKVDVYPPSVLHHTDVPTCQKESIPVFGLGPLCELKLRTFRRVDKSDLRHLLADRKRRESVLHYLSKIGEPKLLNRAIQL